MKQEHALCHLVLAQARELRQRLGDRKQEDPPSLRQLITTLTVEHDRKNKLYLLAFEGTRGKHQLLLDDTQHRFYFLGGKDKAVEGEAAIDDQVGRANRERARETIGKLLEKDAYSVDESLWQSAPVAKHPAWWTNALPAISFLALIAVGAIVDKFTLFFGVAAVAVILWRNGLRPALAGAIAAFGSLLFPWQGSPVLNSLLGFWVCVLVLDEQTWPLAMVPFLGFIAGALAGIPSMGIAATLVSVLAVAGCWLLQPWKYSKAKAIGFSAGVIAGGVVAAVFYVPALVSITTLGGAGNLAVQVALLGVLGLVYWFGGTHRNPSRLLTPLYFFAMAALVLRSYPGDLRMASAQIVALTVGLALIFVSRMGWLRWKTILS